MEETLQQIYNGMVNGNIKAASASHLRPRV
jgi:hypothetical protein